MKGDQPNRSIVPYDWRENIVSREAGGGGQEFLDSQDGHLARKAKALTSRVTTLSLG